MFPAILHKTDLRFAPPERGGIFGDRVFYKRFVPTGREVGQKILGKKKFEL